MPYKGQTATKGGVTYSPAESQEGPTIVNLKRYDLPLETETILKIMFDQFQRVVIKAELRGGLSGSRILVVRPVISDTRALLRTVVKLAPVSLIEKEWWAYKTYIRYRLPDTAQIEDEPVMLPGSQWGGLRYTLIGAGGPFKVESLYQYLYRASADDIRFILEERLFPKLDQSLQPAHARVAFQLQASYDQILPVNLLIEPVIKAGVSPRLLRPDTIPGRALKQGEYVRLEGFVITKVDPGYRAVTLNLPKGHPGGSYALRLKPIEAIGTDRLGDVIAPIEGIIRETRQGRLEAEAGRILGGAFNPAGQRLSGSNGLDLPNPLVKWPAFLKDTRDVKVAPIHGDLNLENILVDPGLRHVSLIDFADARQDHILHDFLRLETEVVTKLIPRILYQQNLPPETICDIYRQLHAAILQPVPAISGPDPRLEKPWAILMAIRKMAGNYLWQHNDWTEYYQGLVLYLLGALKFKNLDKMDEDRTPLPKQVAFWGAALVSGDLQ